MTKAEEILKRIDEVYKTNPKEADRLYNEEYLPLIRKENRKLAKELKSYEEYF